MLFDGGSLVLYMVAVIVYITNIIRGLKMVDTGIYGVGTEKMSVDQRDGVDSGGYAFESGDSVLGREDNLKVLSASNTILALVLVGVLGLQAGQWYAERTDERERKKATQAEAKERAEKAEAGAGNVKRQTSGRESKKSK